MMRGRIGTGTHPSTASGADAVVPHSRSVRADLRVG